MRVWLLHIGEPLPGDGTTRLFRYGHLTRALREAGHEVLRWAPTFCHMRKTHRFPDDRRVTIERGYDVQFVHSPGYSRNTSLSRMRTYRILGRRFRELAAREAQPDAIVAAIPSLEWAEAAADYGRARGVPVVVDVRDLWPDVFVSAMPAWMRPASRLLLLPYEQMARRACRKATALAGVSQTYLDWALQLAGREQRPGDLVAPLGFEPNSFSNEVLKEKVTELRARGIDPERPLCFFAGALERHHEVDKIIEAARTLQARGRSDVQFAICGTGSQEHNLHEQARRISSVHIMGWSDAATLQTLASLSCIGLCAYAKGALMSLGNKPFEYMAGRLAIVSSLPGELAAILQRHECGLTYPAGNAESLAGCLIELLNDPARLNAMRTNSYHTWLRDYRSQDLYARFANHLASLRPAAARAA